MSSFRFEGQRIVYEEFGGGPAAVTAGGARGRTARSAAAGTRPVILVHGLLLSRQMHEPLAEALAARGNRVITVDLLGHGESDRPRDMWRYSMAFFGLQIVALMDHLGLGSAYFGTAIPRDISGLVIAHPERLPGIVLCVPSRLDPASFAGIADRVLMIAGERGPAAEATARATARLPAAERSVLAEYDAPGSWSDAVADRTDEIADRMIAFLDRLAREWEAPGHAEFNDIALERIDL